MAHFASTEIHSRFSYKDIREAVLIKFSGLRHGKRRNCDLFFFNGGLDN